ncbi:MAG: PilW family protein [Betaproteobacteria bacterium]
MRSGQSHRKTLGFSLIELLVAMVIGLITVVVIGQVMAVSEGQKRTTTTGSDAMVNAALGLYTVERDVKNSGYGMMATLGSLGCEIKATFKGVALPSFTLTPVTITDGAAGAPDTIRVLASAKNGITLPTTINVLHPKNAANFFVDSDAGIQEGDLMIAVPRSPSASNWCSVFQVTGTGGGGGGGGGGQGKNQVIHNSGKSEWNTPTNDNFPTDGYAPNDYLINLGQFLDHTYSINANNLRLTQFETATATKTELDIYPQIIQMQAVYGKDTNDDCVVDTWNAVQPTTNAEWQQIRSVRIALVARSQVREKGNVTLSESEVSAAQKCNTATPHSALVCWKPDPTSATSGVEINLNIGGANPDWQRYRYRVFETSVPVRNLIWMQKTVNSACEI